MSLEGKRVAILVEDDYQMHEFWYPFYRFQEAGAEVRVIGTGKDSYTSHGYSVTPNLQAAEAKVDDFDAVIIPGGYAPDKMRRSREMVAFVREMDAAGKPVAAICHAGWMLVSAKIVKGRNATCFYSVRDDLEAAGAQWSDEPVVVDGNLITSRVPGDLPAFCKAVISALSKTAAAVA
ncbi:MAG TPA: type 1 glutamine amidotransferase domain-containing protein [Candidatus Dormibacteraeota bacterium]|nr:type 1 glutamine amidotransferase domain-containing protein [Candidatus Dormibacteraeota bacterium]